MRVLIASIITLAGLTGCQQQPDQAANAQKASQEQARPPLTLSCKGTTTMSIAPPRNETRIIDVPGWDRAGQHLSEYRDAEKLFYEVCPTAVYSCDTVVNDDIIRERGFRLGPPDPNKSSMILTINRRTGRIVQENRVGLDLVSSFEGSCQVIQPPADEAPKF